MLTYFHLECKPLHGVVGNKEFTMASIRVTRILKSKGVLSDTEIAAMTDTEGWAWIYARATPKQEKLPAICFTGFSDDEKNELIQSAKLANMRVVTHVSSVVAFLCSGPNAGPTKLKLANEFDIPILTRDQFLNLVETGELPAGN
ncbi:MAG: hypothetical protein KGM15_11505 [Pseudomonadota bacterium]|nr:hypothetical protein [Pseudomonadota bacterium]